MSEDRAAGSGARHMATEGAALDELSELDSSHGAVTLEYVRVPTEHQLEQLLASGEGDVANDTVTEVELDEGDIEVVADVEPSNPGRPTPPPYRGPTRS